MDELMEKLREAIESGDFEAAENIVQEMEAQDGGEAMAKMAKACMKAAKGAAPPPPKDEPPPVATKRLAATRADLVQGGRNVEAFDRAIANMEAATAEARAAARESKRATVRTLIAANRPMFDAVDERQHLSAADPEATQRHIDSIARHVKAAAEGKGILAASREGGEVSGVTADGQIVHNAKPPKDPKKKDPLAGVTVSERLAMESFNRGKKPEEQITAEDFIRSKQAQTPAGRN